MQRLNFAIVFAEPSRAEPPLTLFLFL